MPRHRRDLENVPGTEYKVLKVPVYSGMAQDLKFLRDQVKYHKVFPTNLQQKNRDAKPIQPPQMEHAWYYLIKKMTATESAKKHFTIQKITYPETDLSSLSRKAPAYEVEFLLWLTKNVVSKAAKEERSILTAGIFPGLSEEEINSLLFHEEEEKEQIVDIVLGDNTNSEIVTMVGGVAEQEKEGGDSVDELVNLFRSVDIKDLEKVEQEELMKLKMDVMDLAKAEEQETGEMDLD